MHLFTKAELAKELGVSPVTIQNWGRDGLACEKQGRGNKYQMKAVLDYLLARQGKTRLDPSQERARLHRSQRQIKELEILILKGEYAPMAEFEELWGQLVGNARAKFLSLPVKLAPTVMAAESMAEIEDASRLLIHEALEELSSASLVA
jgi:phage terminase Nu1 subunit (DNA packaging protein)